MFTSQLVLIRQNTSTPFHAVDAATLSHWTTTYVTTGLVSRSESLTPDKLTKTIVNTWKEEADWNSFLADPVMAAFRAARTAYDKKNNITETLSTAGS
jgi:hypothetical protein